MTKEIIFKVEKTKKKNWSFYEDQIILKFSKTLPRNKKWINISELINKRTPIQCYRRLKSIDPKFKKGRWSKEEDKLLINLVNCIGKSWKIISKIFKNRSNKQIKLRYDEHLNPKIFKGKFKKSEDKMITKLYEKYFNRWSKYQKYLPNRTQNKIKTRVFHLKNKKFNN